MEHFWKILIREHLMPKCMHRIKFIIYVKSIGKKGSNRKARLEFEGLSVHGRAFSAERDYVKFYVHEGRSQGLSTVVLSVRHFLYRSASIFL